MTLFDRHILSCYYFCNYTYNNKNNNYLARILLTIVYKYYSIILKFIYGAFIPYKASLGKNINFVHSFHGIFISQNAIIGNNCIILHHTTIGSNNGIAPIIGNNVFIGCNSTIIGKTKIGSNSKVGAGSVIVNKEIKSNSLIYNESIVIKEGEI